ncbi:hypothetical protein ABIC94_003744 [Variovorax paradoxus]|uniref:hypothetical protein n=1 Tax=Variovorax paradoxus TaxID=34073 RepID=UPI003394E814
MISRITQAALLLVCSGFLQQVAAQDFRSLFATEAALSLAMLSRSNLCTEMGRIADSSNDKRYSGTSLEELLSGLDKVTANPEVPDFSRQLVKLVAVDVFNRPRPPGAAVGDEVTLACKAQLIEQITIKSAAPMPDADREALKMVMSKDYVPLGMSNVSRK